MSEEAPVAAGGADASLGEGARLPARLVGRFSLRIRLITVAAYLVMALGLLFAILDNSGPIRVLGVATLVAFTAAACHILAARILFGPNEISRTGFPFHRTVRPYDAVKRVAVLGRQGVYIYFRDYGPGLRGLAARQRDKLAADIWLSKNVFLIPAVVVEPRLVCDFVIPRTGLHDHRIPGQA